MHRPSDRFTVVEELELEEEPMATLEEAVSDFLGQKRIAVAGVSRDPNQSANAIFRMLSKAGYQVFPVNPNADEVEGQPCFRDLKTIPGGVDGVLVVTAPTAAKQVVAECVDLNISRVWMHRSFGAGSVSEEAVAFCREHQIQVIAGGCPMMFVPGADVAHKCMRWVLNLTGGFPKRV
jgi:predicted CoA-binding protein